LQEHGSKIPQSVKDQVRGDISALNEAIVSENIEKIKENLERLKNTSMEIGKAIYSQQSSDDSSSQSTEESKKEDDEKKDEEKK